MSQTRIYLTDKQLAALQSLSRDTGLTQSELIRQAVDRFVDKHRPGDRKVLLRAAKGLWRERTDCPTLLRSGESGIARGSDGPTGRVTLASGKPMRGKCQQTIPGWRRLR